MQVSTFCYALFTAGETRLGVVCIIVQKRTQILSITQTKLPAVLIHCQSSRRDLQKPNSSTQQELHYYLQGEAHLLTDQMKLNLITFNKQLERLCCTQLLFYRFLDEFVAMFHEAAHTVSDVL